MPRLPRQSLDALRTEIESIVRERQSVKARERIPAFLRMAAKAGSSEEALFEACDWYRRLGMFREAFRLIRLEGRLPTQLKTSEPLGRKALWAARLLNAMGAGPIALELLKRLKLSTPSDHRMAGDIFITQFEPKLALLHYDEALKKSSARSSYSERLMRVDRADALAALGRIGEAIQSVREIAKESSEPLLLGICASAEGEYLARDGRYSEALECFERARELSPPSETAPDSALLDKWQGYALVRLGRRKEGLVLLERAETQLRKSAIRPESWGSVVRLRLSADPAALEEERQRLAHYPGWMPGFLGESRPSGVAVFGDPEKSQLVVRMDSGEYRYEGEWYLGFPKEIRLAGALRIAGDWGISIPSVLSLLWPDEAHAYLELESRLHQILRRLRKEYGVSARIDERTIELEPGGERRVCAISGTGERPDFLSSHPRFGVEDFLSHYALKKSAAHAWLEEWEQRGWVRVEREGRKKIYVVSAHP